LGCCHGGEKVGERGGIKRKTSGYIKVDDVESSSSNIDDEL